MSGADATAEATRPAGDGDVHTAVAHADKRAARILAQALRDQGRARDAAQRAEAKAAAAREREAVRARRAVEEALALEARRARRRTAFATVAQWVGRAVEVARREAAAGYSMAVYGAVVYVAASSQTQVFHEQFHWALPRAIGAAAFIEGTSLAFALTAHRLRLEGENARIARTLTWVAALFGAGVNYTAHAFDPSLPPWMAQLQAIALGTSSLVGIVLWEVRSGARSRKALRQAERRAHPKPQLGWDYWVRYRREAFWAWSAMVADPNVRTRDDAITEGRKLLAQHDARRAQAVAQRRAAEVEKAFMAAARKAARKAAAKGEPGPALSYLALLAQQGPNLMRDRPPLGAVAVELPPDSAGSGHAEAVPRCGGGGSKACGRGEGTARLAEAVQALTVGLEALGEVGRRATGGPAVGPEQAWQQRLDELDDAYRGNDGSELPIPGRREVIAHMGARGGLRYAWTSHSIVDNAIKDLRARRAASPPSAAAS